MSPLLNLTPNKEGNHFGGFVLGSPRRIPLTMRVAPRDTANGKSSMC